MSQTHPTMPHTPRPEPTLGEVVRQIETLTEINIKQSASQDQVLLLLRGPLDDPKKGLIFKQAKNGDDLKDHLEWHEKQKRKANWMQRSIITVLLTVGGTLLAAWLVNHWHLDTPLVKP